ncbi:MAG: regulatory signaling modulator protein AmpE [Pseudomonadota bacterium]
MITAITLILALCLEHIVWNASRWRAGDIFITYYQRALAAKPLVHIAHHITNPNWMLIPLVLLVVICQFVIMPALGALFIWMFGLAALLFSFGPRNLGRDLEAYLQARTAGQNQHTNQIASYFAEMNPHHQDPDHQVKQGLLIQANQALIGPIVSFVLFGAIGAVLYRILDHLVSLADTATIKPDLARSLRQVHIWANWLPARITALGYAITGHFEAVISAWRTLEREHTWNHTALLQATGEAALTNSTATGRDSVLAYAALIKRTILLWAGVITFTALLSAF